MEFSCISVYYMIPVYCVIHKIKLPIFMASVDIRCRKNQLGRCSSTTGKQWSYKFLTKNMVLDQLRRNFSSIYTGYFWSSDLQIQWMITV